MKTTKSGLLATILALLTSFGVPSAPATAQGFEFEFGERGVRVERPDDYDRRYYRRDDYDRRHYRRDDRRDRPGCSPRAALSAASRHLNDPFINAENRSYYYIGGYGKRGGARGRVDSVIISKAPGCPRV
ncbi:hypothetical protein [Neorhizobium sp. LjRoot104]|uniref:hypothetical protein n=1 Tax=Neorhizobium sp. LjRoot104 TaxID=3342254 RepID=UPI003ED0196E